MTSTRLGSWLAAVALSIALVTGGCDSDDGGGGSAGAGGTATGGGGRGGTTGGGGTTGSGNAGTTGSGNAGRAGGGTTGSAGRGGGGRGGGTGGMFSFDGGLDAILADAGITTCPAGVMSGSACTTGTDTGCLPASGGNFCFCQNGSWSCF